MGTNFIDTSSLGQPRVLLDLFIGISVSQDTFRPCILISMCFPRHGVFWFTFTPSSHSSIPSIFGNMRAWDWLLSNLRGLKHRCRTLGYQAYGYPLYCISSQFWMRHCGETSMRCVGFGQCWCWCWWSPAHCPTVSAIAVSISQALEFGGHSLLGRKVCLSFCVWFLWIIACLLTFIHCRFLVFHEMSDAGVVRTGFYCCNLDTIHNRMSHTKLFSLAVWLQLGRVEGRFKILRDTGTCCKANSQR